MKKSLFYFFLLFLCATQVHAQSGSKFSQLVEDTDLGIPPDFQTTTYFETLDNIKLIATYEVKMNLAPDKEKGTFEDIMTLEIGNKLSKCYSQKLYEYDSDWTKEEKKREVMIRNSFPYYSVGVEVYKFTPYGRDQKDIATVRLFGFDDVYRYEDDKPAINWKLTTDKKVFLGYHCQKAIGEFRGRLYEAWFTMEIPYRDGPYKFDGLPGLILDIKDSKGEYHWSCIGITTPQKEMKIKQYKWNYVTKTRAYVCDRIEHAYKHTSQYVKTTKIKLMQRINGKFVEAVDFSLPYNPIELE